MTTVESLEASTAEGGCATQPRTGGRYMRRGTGFRVAVAIVSVLMAVSIRQLEAGEMLADLPEGDGSAARYPGDKGIETDPAVVFADGFETV